MNEKISRKSFLLITGGISAALISSGCEKPVQKLIPYVNQPNYPEPGEWAFYATTCRECPAGCGMHLWYRDGRVTKAEGNPESKINEGGLCARGQSSLQGLYDPERIQNVLRKKYEDNFEITYWETAIDEIGKRLKNLKGKIFLVSDLQTGALDEVMNKFTQAFSSPSPIYYEAYNYESVKKANQKVFGSAVVPNYKIDQADLLISFGVDFLETWISPVQFASQFKKMHEYKNGKIGEFIYFGPRLSMTAANADKFYQVPAGIEISIANAILKELNYDGEKYLGEVDDIYKKYISENEIKKIAQKISKSGSGLALGGPSGGKGKHSQANALAAALINKAMESENKTIDLNNFHALTFTTSNEEIKNTCSKFTKDDIIIINNTNPVFTDSKFKTYLKNAGLVVYLGNMGDETAVLADWILPINYPLETWGDYEPIKGVNQLIQPTMQPLYDTHTAGDILIGLADAAGKTLNRNDNESTENFYDWLRARWKEIHNKSNSANSFEDFWDESLRKGGYEGVSISKNPKNNYSNTLLSYNNSNQSLEKNEFNLWAYPSIFFFDGRTANRGWLQEAPDPMSTIVWGSWIDMNPKNADDLDLENGDIIEIKSSTGKIKAPIRITEEVIENTLAIQFGQGHTELGKNARGIGANPFNILEEDNFHFAKVKLSVTGESKMPINLSKTQEQFGRDIVKWISLEELKNKNEMEEIILPLPEGYNEDRDLYSPHNHAKRRWSMTIDLQSCTGCGACAVACYAENNIFVVGAEHCAEGREMAWLKVTPYKKENEKNKIGFFPLPCQHCDAAPCEPVCPVFAAVHNEEGLNAQIYNRCIGTRYCSNNCPYKVRRFNWFTPEFEKPLNVQLNPEVTVRTRGVMEKCTFCVQRIRSVEYKAMNEGRKIEDGEIKPACVQSCPTKAFQFGDLLNKESKVHGTFNNDSRRYQVLKELNTKPAVVYLKRIDTKES